MQLSRNTGGKRLERRRAGVRLRVEELEDRLTPSWAGVPPAVVTPTNAVSVTLDANRAAVGSASIAGIEVDYYAFTAPATGAYLFTARTPATSSLDTVLGVFTSTGQRIAFNDDIVRFTQTDSKLTVSLTAGQQYYFGITNYTDEGPGAYSWAVQGPRPAAQTTSKIDLAGVALRAPTSAAWGQTINLAANVRNVGTQAAGSFQVEWYLSQDGTGSASDILLPLAGGATSFTVSGLAAGAIRGIQTSVTLPSSAPAGWSGGAYYIVMRTDSANEVAESSENNNFGQVGLTRDVVSIAVGATAASGFHIDLNLVGMTAVQQNVFRVAAARWEQVIIGDLPDAVFRGRVVRGILIDASATRIDGSGGVLGESAPDAFRPGSFLPYHGYMHFDVADLASMQADGTLRSVILHEMGHVLGIGTIWEDLHLLVGAGTGNPRFVGANATAAYNQIFNRREAGVPVENTGGDGTADSHWRESVLSNELMTGWVGPGNYMPLSRITIGSLADLGYRVNYAAADPFTL